MPLKQDTVLFKTLHLDEIEPPEGDNFTANSTPQLSERDEKSSPSKAGRRRRKKAKGLDPAEAMN